MAEDHLLLEHCCVWPSVELPRIRSGWAEMLPQPPYETLVTLGAKVKVMIDGDFGLVLDEYPC